MTKQSRENVLQGAIFRIGLVLRPSDVRLSLSQAKDVGSYIIEHKCEVAAEHMKTLELLAENRGAKVTAILNNDQGMESVRVSFNFVPIVRFPACKIESGGISFRLTQALTICGGGSSSKLWIIAEPLMNHQSAISMSLLTKLHGEFLSLRKDSLGIFCQFYKSLLERVGLSLNFPNEIARVELQELAAAEFLTVMSSRSALMELREHIQTREEHAGRPVGSVQPDGNSFAPEFVDWVNSNLGCDFEDSKAKLEDDPPIGFNIFPEDGANPTSSLPSIVLSKVAIREKRCVHRYGTLLQAPEPGEADPSALLRQASRLLATEYGRRL